ncbi:TPA: hypothetical protein DEG21_00640 [Patescibacteria group bacterium]|nr:hypothetical protein [Candidatus Gracilibacteria bacterium]
MVSESVVKPAISEKNILISFLSQSKFIFSKLFKTELTKSSAKYWLRASFKTLFHFPSYAYLYKFTKIKESKIAIKK